VLKDIDGKPRAYPQNQDPYEEIYKNTTWYGLVPEQNSQYLDMSDKKEGLRVGPRDNFEDLIDSIANFHGELGETSKSRGANRLWCRTWRISA
ncbi:hypothetical protein RIM94_36330, partial [Pseudomonas aeruginosa]|nr:hypothetical protein [Pseudomonas aeruginosa]